MTDVMELFFSMLALLCQVFVVGVIIFRLYTLVTHKSESWKNFVAAISPFALYGALAVALVTTAGSLYMSEIAHFKPCHLCWIQRGFIYPQIIVTALLVWRPAMWTKVLSLVLAACSIPVSTYHYLLEWYPNLETSVCAPTNPCYAVWFREFGYITLPLMALSAAGTIATLVLVHRKPLPAS